MTIPALALLTACGGPAGKPAKVTKTTELKATDSIVTKNTPAEITADQLIIPGKGIGRTHLHDDLDDVISRLGKPDAGDAAMGKSASTWYADHDSTKASTTVFASRQMGTADDTARVKQIRITSPWFKTADGIMTGSTKATIQKIYAKLQETNSPISKGPAYADLNAGIAFEFDAQKKCTAILVMPVGKQ